MHKLRYIDVAAALGTVYLVAKLIRQRARRVESLPPGPPGHPIIGNLLEWPNGKEWETFTEWAKIYGVYINIIFS